jgi:hypothetical protein
LLDLWPIHFLFFKNHTMQKHLLLLALWAGWLGTQPLSAQNCGLPQSFAEINANNIRAKIPNAGDLFFDGSDAGYFPLTPSSPNQNVATVFAGGLWLIGVDQDGNLRGAARTYRIESSESQVYVAGPLELDGTKAPGVCQNWDRHFVAKAEDISTFLANLPTLTTQQAIQQFPSIMGWPGRGNPHFSAVHSFDLPNNSAGLAPFHDVNNDGLYNPMQGDYPVVALRNKPLFVADQMIWSVFSTTDISDFAPTPIEFQQQVWAFDCPEETTLQNSIFTSYKIICRDTQRLDSVRLGVFIDFDLGCYFDDYLGTIPESNAVFMYNADLSDGVNGSCSGIPFFTGAVPIQSMSMLDRSLDRTIAYNNPSIGNPSAATTDPELDIEFYSYLNGRWRDDTPLTFGGGGYGGPTATDYFFPDDPADPTGWSACTLGGSSGDQRMLAVTDLDSLLPGQVTELTLAWTTHASPNATCSRGQVVSDIATVQNLFNNGFSGTCLPLLSSHEALKNIDLVVSPNPARNEVTLRYPSIKPLVINLLAPDGRLVRSVQNPPADQITLDVAALPAGVYAIQIRTDEGLFTRKVSVVR